MTNAKLHNSLVARIKATGASLLNDTRYWEIRRTYGDNSKEVLRYLSFVLRALQGSAE